MKLEELLPPIEKKWENKLLEASGKCFKNVHLPSHDHWHHYRVWKYAKELLKRLSPAKEFTPDEITNLIIAAFFHDTGMSVTNDESHGKESKQICQQFFNNNQIQVPENFNSALEAIEHHDDKAYPENIPDRDISINTILSVADDLDAFGYIGILRYAEIYLLRKISISEISNKVISNAERRLKHFKNHFNAFPDLVEKHHERLDILIQFYKNLNNNEENQKLIEQVNKNIAETYPDNLTGLINGLDKNNSTFSKFRNNVNKELASFENNFNELIE